MNNAVLLQQLTSPDPDLKAQAMLKIGNSFDPQFMLPLAEAANPEAPELELLLIKYLQNLPLKLSLPYLLPLSRSPNEVTAKNLFTALDQLDPEQNPELIKKVMSYKHEPVQLFILRKLEASRRELLLPDVASLLSSPSRVLTEAAFKLIAGWNFPASIALLLPFLKAKQTFRQVLAVSALGRISAFRKWKLLLPFLNSPQPEVRQATVQSIRLCSGTVPSKIFLKALKQEKKTEVSKVLITALTGVQKRKVICELIRLAALHPVSTVRKTANWAVNECRGKILKQCIRSMLKAEDEILCRYLITKIGELQLVECGHMVVSFLNEKAPVTFRYAALESLCLLKEKKYLSRIRPYINSTDAMEAYLATIAAANTIATLDECSELWDIFFSVAPQQEILKQTLLELMNGPLRWDVNAKNILAVLKENLKSKETNTRYLSIFLIKQTQDSSFIPLLTQMVNADPDQAVRDAALQCIDSMLKGDVGYYLEELTSARHQEEQQARIMALLLRLNWDQRNARKAISFFTGEQWQVENEGLTLLAAKLYLICPGEIEDFIKQENKNTPWLLALANAWLANLNPLNTESNKERWLTLLDRAIPGLQVHLVRKAVENKSKWALEPLLKSLEKISDPSVAGLTKRAIKTIIEL